MFLDEYDKFTQTEFKGIFSRGTTQDLPDGFVSDAQNVDFGYTGKCITRGSLATSYAVSHAVVRMFLSSITSTYRLLTCDGAGNIYNGTSVLFSASNLVDFAAINLANRTYIAPIYSASGANQNLLVYDGTNIRAAAGTAPSSSFTVSEPSSGNVDPGEHKFAVCYITDTGFTTQPGPKIAGVFTPVAFTSAGSKNIRLTGIPTGPSGTVGRLILVTRAGLNLYYELATINDNVTTTLDVDFQDTSLVVSADDLFDQLETIPLGAPGFGGLSLQKYKGRLLVVGADGDQVYVSEVDEPESFSAVTGFLILPTENDGNQVRAAVVHYDVLYLTKAVGIYSTQDNDSGNPSSWKVLGPQEGAVGAYANAIATITQSQTALTTQGRVVVACRAGIFVFQGAVEHPALTWKIQAIWDRFTVGTENKIQVLIDPFQERLYCLLCVDGSTSPNLLLVGFYHNGLTADGIQWSIYSFPSNPTAIAMINFNDGDDFAYYLRVCYGTAMYKLKSTHVGDYGNNITSFIRTKTWKCPEDGQLCLYAFNEVSVGGSGTLTLTYKDQSNNVISSGAPADPTITLASAPTKDYLKRILIINEGVGAILTVVGTTSYFDVNQVQLYWKKYGHSRPNY